MAKSADNLRDNPFAALFDSEEQLNTVLASFDPNRQVQQISGNSRLIEDDQAVDITMLDAIETCVFKSNDEAIGAVEQHIEHDSVTKSESPVAVKNTETDDYTKLKDIQELSHMLEDIFRITLQPPGLNQEGRLSKYTWLPDLHETLTGQDFLDVSCIQQAVFERIMMPGDEEVTAAKLYEDETNAVAYLAACFLRIKNFKSKSQLETLARCQQVTVVLGKLCFQNPDVIPQQCRPGHQFVRLLLNAIDRRERADWLLEYFESVAKEIASNVDEGTVLESFRSALDIITDRFTKVTLDDRDLMSLVDLVAFFTRTSELAEAFLDYIRPPSVAAIQSMQSQGAAGGRQPVNGRDFERTLMGAMLSVSCLPKIWGVHQPVASSFFEHPSRMSQSQVDTLENFIHPMLERLDERIYQIVYALLKFGGKIRSGILGWIGACLHANSGRAKLWSQHQMDPQLFGSAYASDSFFLNLSAVLLRLCRPFCTGGDKKEGGKTCSGGMSSAAMSKLLRVQPTYCLAAEGTKEQSAERDVHMFGLKETCLVPAGSTSTMGDDTAVNSDEPASQRLLEDQYSFTTECFFMTHYCLRLGFHVLHEQFVKLNQELHRIRGVYEEVAQQGAGASETAQQLKNEMDRVMTVYLCQKCALTEPTLLDHSFIFQVATAIYLVAITIPGGRNGSTLSFPLPDTAPRLLEYVPEMLAENLQDFMLFIKRFKDSLYEQHGEELEPLLTVIIVYMSSRQYMRNPHLRAGMAEALDALIPPRSMSAIRQSSFFLPSHMEREKLFRTHPHVSHLTHALISVFVSIEMTGQGVQFEHKFKYRQPMYIALEYLWKIDVHREAIKGLAVYAEAHANDVEAPLFLRFINLLINDAIFLLDDALNYMSQIKEKQTERDRGDWAALAPRARQEVEGSFRHMSMLARFHNIMGNETIAILETLTQDIRSVFTMNVMIDRIAAMLNYFLLHLVGPKKRNLKVNKPEDFEFKPRELVANIARIYMNLGCTDSDDSDDTERSAAAFCLAVSQDTRSYSHDLFQQAEAVMIKISQPPEVIAQWTLLADEIKKRACDQAKEDELLTDIPDDFIDPIMGSLMRDPVILPSSGKIVDRQTIARHILSDQFDPFNRQPLTMDMVQPAVDLKQQIVQWIEQHRHPDTVVLQSNGAGAQENPELVESESAEL